MRFIDHLAQHNLSLLAMAAETSARRWASSGQANSKVQKPAKSSLPKDRRPPVSLLQLANGRTRPQTAAVRSTTAPETLASGRPSSSRPRSGKTRPLSGRVFLEKTVMKGWIARSTTDLQVSEWDEDEWWGEQDEWGGEDYLAGGGSDTVLDGLLSSRQIMDSKPKQHTDWVAGEVNIPRFHCPRCRDHWYGLTPFPCDEELARLIRDGLWYTGQGPVDRDLLFKKRGDLHSGGKGEHSGSGCGSDVPKLPDIVPQRSDSETSLSGSGSRHRLSEGKQDGKKGKRISFNLEAEEFRYDKDKPTRSPGQNQTSARRSDSNLGDQRDGLDGEGGAVTGTGDSTSSDLSRLNGLTRDTIGENLLVDKSDLISSGLDSDSKGSKYLKSSISKDQDPNRTGTGNKQEGLSSLGSAGRFKSNSQFGKPNGVESVDSDHTGLSGASKGGPSNGTIANGTDLLSGLTGNGSLDSEGKNTSDLSRNRHAGIDSSGGLGDDSNRTKTNSSDEDEKNGTPDSQHTDKGKNVRVAKAGFIARASSPTGSEWGDPTHALAYLSNTTSSSRAGSSLGGRIHDDNYELGKASSDPQLLKSGRKSDLLSSEDIILGPMLTRAFTFSYHKDTSCSSSLAGANRNGQSKVRAKKGKKKR